VSDINKERKKRCSRQFYTAFKSSSFTQHTPGNVCL